MLVFSMEEVLTLHRKIINKTGGSHGVRDKALLKSALQNPFQTFAGMDLYKDDIEKIAVLSYSVINNHCMLDGNKRLGISLLCLLCQLNNINISYTQKELIKLGLSIAKDEFNKDDIEEWIRNHMGK
ncbi:type II toxin-antitoxin system death-on-curing family toxin [Clostridium botulinum]|uniref:type II toxin-antitoxin system death-on-curing family toxin n=1 Tax=Clostridium botulinum TaxID=1491 RepID=UPI002491623F|nr:type II toxin-antitoxin system death-on-curing family toxin [Clostridium botulinum]BDB03606.1 death-on-curing protein [Clostridium botulinum]